MAFEISQLTNVYLKDLATSIDGNNDGVISNGSEVSVFLAKSKDVVETGLCSEAEYTKILGYCPREISIRGEKTTIGTLEYEANEKAQNAYLESLKLEVTKELEARNLEQTADNVSLVMEIIKKKKELNVQIKIQEAKIEELKNRKPEDAFEARTEVITSTSMATGAVGGAWLGFKVGATFGVPGMVIGAAIGGLVGTFVTGLGGVAIAKATIPEDELKQIEKQNQEELLSEMKKLEELKTEYENL